MADPTLGIFPDGEPFFRGAAERIAAILKNALSRKEIASLVLTGGNTPTPVYERLADPSFAHIDWGRIHFFWGDERCVPPESPDSNFGMAWKAFLSRLRVPPDHVHRMIGEARDVEKAASDYEDEICKTLPFRGIPCFDLVLLGIGKDGHTASLFPGTKWDEEKLVVSNRAPETGAARLSMTPRILNEAETIMFLVSGTSKSRVIAEVLKNPSSPLPASRIHPVRGRLIWLMDHSAASLIESGRNRD